MSTYQDSMRKLVDQFVDQLGDLYRQAVTDALGLGGSAPTRGGATPTKVAARGRGVKRDPSELESLADSFVEFVHKNPGLRIEQINKELGTTTKELMLPIRKLIAEGTIKTKGAKRSTTYYADGKRKKN